MTKELRDKGFSRQKEVSESDEVLMWAKRLSCGSDEVLSSLSYLYCKPNGKRVSDQRSKCWNAQYELIIHVISIFVSNLVFSLVFWTTLPASRGLYSMKKPRELVHNKCKTLFIISWPFWTNIEYSHRVPTLIFFRNYCLRVDRHESVTKHQDFLICPSTTISSTKIENYNWNHLTFLNKVYSFTNDWVSFSVEIVEQFQTAG